MNIQNSHKYDDIIHLPHHVSKNHPRMSPMNRAAQFMPFAALTGHEEAIQETARLTDSFVELDEDRKAQLNQQLLMIREHLALPDEKKTGGTYASLRGRIKNIDESVGQIIFTDGTALPMEYLFSIKGELFRDAEVRHEDGTDAIREQSNYTRE